MKSKPSKEERLQRYVDVDSTYVNAFLKLRCAPRLLEFEILKRMSNQCKEITKCMGVFRAILRGMGAKRMEDEDVLCVVIEHAPKQALTSFLIKQITKWTVVVVNPNHNSYEVACKEADVQYVKGRIEHTKFAFPEKNTLVVVTAHSIRGDFKAINVAWSKIEAKQKWGISLPLTAKMDCDGRLVKTYEDEHVVSLSREIRIWRPY